MSAKDGLQGMNATWKEWKISKGRGRAILFAVAERIEGEYDENGAEKPGHHPKPKNPIERALYEFLKICMSGDIAYVRELLDRLDGKPAQAIAIEDKRDLTELSDAQLDAARQTIQTLLRAQGDRAGAGEAGESEPVDAV